MKVLEIGQGDDFANWRKLARDALMAGCEPHELRFATAVGEADLFTGGSSRRQVKLVSVTRGDASIDETPFTVPSMFLELGRRVACHRDPMRYDLLYRLLWRLQTERSLLANPADEDVHRAVALAKAVRRDVHKMKAFVRFRKVGESIQGVEQFVAWFEPTHHIVRLTAPFFSNRFANMNWSILTPDACAHWAGGKITFSDGLAARPESSRPDELEDYWRSYYASIFNPARLKISAMKSEMPVKYWCNLPEAELIPDLIAEAQQRESDMRSAVASKPKPAMMRHRAVRARQEQTSSCEASEPSSLADIGISLESCRRCSLWRSATQAVAGEGSVSARLVVVGEQPGDHEDVAGKPFVGPAGRLLRSLLAEACIEERDIFVTNAVKHFKYQIRGKRRIHQNPSVREIDHCRWWLMRELAAIQPTAIVALGASALRGALGRTVAIARVRGQWLHGPGDAVVMPTFHPSYVLRQRDEVVAKELRALILRDLREAKSVALTGSRGSPRFESHK